MYAKTNRNTLAQFKRDRSRLVHVSAVAKMIDNPLAIAASKAGLPFMGPKLIPYIQKPGVTLNTGRNAAKRAARIGAAA